MDWTTTTVTRTLYTGPVGVTQRHCSDLKLTRQICIYSKLRDGVQCTLTVHCTVQDIKGEGDLTSGLGW